MRVPLYVVLLCVGAKSEYCVACCKKKDIKLKNKSR